jgi:hypothetical protein
MNRGSFMTFRVLLLFLVSVLGISSAHGLYEAYLDHTVLCLDDDSVTVVFEDAPDADLPFDAKALDVRLHDALRQILQSSGVRLKLQGSCVESSSYALLHVVVRELDPQLFTQYPAGTLAFSVDVQVGFYAQPEYLAVFGELPNPVFMVLMENVRTDGPAGLGEAIHAQARELVRGLAVEWWEDNPPVAAASVLPQYLGAGLTLLVVVGLFLGVTWRKAAGKLA